MSEPAPTTRYEPRWPVVITILAVLILQLELPERVKLAPGWTLYVGGIAVMAPMVAVGLSSAKTFWLRVERIVTLFFSVVIGLSTVLILVTLISEMLNPSGKISGLQLLASSVAVWVFNVLAFTLLYWQIDRGGPDARANNTSPRPDWLFPQEGAPEEDLSADWRPMFVDYLFLGYCTATAFSPTDALPLTPRAKVLMMLQSSISLVTIVVVASRAIGLLK